MKIYNADKTQIITNPDLTLGRLTPDRLQTGMAEAVIEQGEYIRSEPNEQGYVNQEYAVTIPPKPAEPIYEDIQVYIQWTAEEIKANRISEINVICTELNKDFLQVQAGFVIDNIEDKYAEFRTLHNERRELLGLEPREVE